VSKNRARGDKKRHKPRGREAPLPEFVQDALQQQRNAFREKFGRDPVDGDPVFFDPDADTPVEISSVRMEAGLLEAMRRAGTPPHIVYAFRKTGLLGTRRTSHAGRQHAGANTRRRSPTISSSRKRPRRTGTDRTRRSGTAR